MPEREILIRIGKDTGTGNFWIDNGIVALEHVLAEGEYPIQVAVEAVVARLIEETGNQGEYYDSRTRSLRTYPKRNWVYPAGQFIKVTGQVSKIRIGDKTYYLGPPKYELKPSFGSRGVCDICGTEARLADARMWSFPFVVAPDKFGNFYSKAKRGLRTCPKCTVAGLAAHLKWLWYLHQRKRLHLFLFHTDMSTLKMFHREILRPMMSEGQKGANVSLPFRGSYIHETTLALLLNLFVLVREPEEISAEGRELLEELLSAKIATQQAPLRLYSAVGNVGKSFSVQDFKEFSNLHILFRLYSDWLDLLETPNPHDALVRVFRQFEEQRNNHRETIWREEIARGILHLEDISMYVERYLFDVRARNVQYGPLVFGTVDIVNHYMTEVMAMDSQLMEVIRSFGRLFGAKAAPRKEPGSSDEKGLLFSLRNAKNPEDYFRVLNDAQFRLGITIPDELLEIETGETIRGTPWIRVKTLLSIHAMNSYLWATAHKKEGA